MIYLGSLFDKFEEHSTYQQAIRRGRAWGERYKRNVFLRKRTMVSAVSYTERDIRVYDATLKVWCKCADTDVYQVAQHARPVQDLKELPVISMQGISWIVYESRFWNVVSRSRRALKQVPYCHAVAIYPRPSDSKIDAIVEVSRLTKEGISVGACVEREMNMALPRTRCSVTMRRLAYLTLSAGMVCS